MARQAHIGGCHCGAVRFEVLVDLEEVEILDCNCSICVKKGILHLIVDRTDFRLLQGEDALSEYRFGTRQAVHTFCSVCGMHPFYTPRSHPNDIDINARCLDDVSIPALNVVPFDGQNWEDNIDSIR